ncbi:hypothetical protein [Sphingobium sp. SCG-1]|uniref:hypothetical protein n=1 Tax=Sphingobium sp. SCG-1 TaxID=2072936 RepID=UPI0011AB8E0A|nr:hypothetical protein [Sphingobium sp. SCG-1]
MPSIFALRAHSPYVRYTAVSLIYATARQHLNRWTYIPLFAAARDRGTLLNAAGSKSSCATTAKDTVMISATGPNDPKELAENEDDTEEAMEEAQKDAAEEREEEGGYQ